MQDFSIPCGYQVGEAISLSPALHRLKQEHIPLREQLEQLYQMAIKIGKDDSREDWHESLLKLKEKVVRFEQDLNLHSLREEELLFPMMAQYIGRETGPLAVMEFEHEQGKKNLKTFIAKVDPLTSPVDFNTANHITSFMIEAYQVLTQHFRKEEQVLFPMAENLLSKEEKAILEKKMKTV